MARLRRPVAAGRGGGGAWAAGRRRSTPQAAALCPVMPVPGVAGVADARPEGCGRLGAPRLVWSTGMLCTEGITCWSASVGQQLATGDGVIGATRSLPHECAV